MRAKRASAVPSASERSTRSSACARSGASLPSTSISAASSRVTSSNRGSRRTPLRKSSASCTSTTLPQLWPSTWFMSVIKARVGNPAPLATDTSDCASCRAMAGVPAKAPLPTFTSSTRPCRPAASFLDRMLAVISAMDSTVAVTSRIAYSRRSAGASSAVCPMMAQPAPCSALRSRLTPGAVW